MTQPELALLIHIAEFTIISDLDTFARLSRCLHKKTVSTYTLTLHKIYSATAWLTNGIWRAICGTVTNITGSCAEKSLKKIDREYFNHLTSHVWKLNVKSINFTRTFLKYFFTIFMAY